MTSNLGATSLKRRRRQSDPMQAHDALPSPLRNWLADAVLPWSPASCRRVWIKARQKGKGVEEALQALQDAEQRTLDRDKASRMCEVTLVS